MSKQAAEHHRKAAELPRNTVNRAPESCFGPPTEVVPCYSS